MGHTKWMTSRREQSNRHHHQGQNLSFSRPNIQSSAAGVSLKPQPAAMSGHLFPPTLPPNGRSTTPPRAKKQCTILNNFTAHWRHHITVCKATMHHMKLVREKSFSVKDLHNLIQLFLWTEKHCSWNQCYPNKVEIIPNTVSTGIRKWFKLNSFL